MAWAKEALTLDLSAGATVSSNPFLDPAGGRAAVGVQTGADANYRIESERTTLNLGAGGQSSTWFDGRGTDLTGSVSADLQHRVSDRASVQLLGHYRYSRSAGYEYLFAPGFGSPLQPGIPAGTGGAGGAGGTGGTGTTPPIITVPSPLGPGNGAGLPPDATVIGRRIGQHAFGGAINVELRTSARSTLSLAADANEMRYSDPLLSNYRMFSQAAAYAHRLTEATTVMARMSVAEIKYANGEHRASWAPTLTWRSMAAPRSSARACLMEPASGPEASRSRRSCAATMRAGISASRASGRNCPRPWAECGPPRARGRPIPTGST
jgi:hypothetical protein